MQVFEQEEETKKHGGNPSKGKASKPDTERR